MIPALISSYLLEVPNRSEGPSACFRQAEIEYVCVLGSRLNALQS